MIWAPAAKVCEHVYIYHMYTYIIYYMHVHMYMCKCIQYYIHKCSTVYTSIIQYLNNLVSRRQLLRLAGDAAGRNVRDEDSCVSLSPDDVEP